MPARHAREGRLDGVVEVRPVVVVLGLPRAAGGVTEQRLCRRDGERLGEGAREARPARSAGRHSEPPL